jgi:raffinose/stachyose/melibiose transport system permease protein
MTKSRSRILQNNIQYGLILFIPFIWYLVIFAIPVIQGIGLSFIQWDGLSQNREFVGFGNYIRLLTANTKFGIAFANTLVYMLFAVVVSPSLGLIVAVLIFKSSRLNNLFRLIFYMPGILSTVAVSFMWIFAIYNPNFGLLNKVLESVGLGFLARAWLGERDIVVIMVAVVQVYMDFGGGMILFIAGLQNIPSDFYEAADIEGAGGVQKFFYITLPSLKATISLVILLEMINAVRSFDLMYLLASGTEVLSTFLFKELFTFGRVGVGCATAVFLLFLIFIFNGIQNLIIREDD